MGIVVELEKAFITMQLSGGRINRIKSKSKYAGGGVALGYSAKDKDLIINTGQAETIKQIFKMKRHQRKGLKEIARTLNTQCTPTAREGQVARGDIKYILSTRFTGGSCHIAG